MEHREPPRIASGDRRFDGAIEEPGGGFRLRRFDPSRDRRQLDFRRAGLLTLAAIAVLAGVIYVALRATRAAVGWLNHQSTYQLPFNQIHLATDPPAWYRGGAQEFLERVRLGAGEAEQISLLEVVPERLTLAFKKYAWVEEVVKVTYGPGRIVVDLRYRRPVASVDLPPGNPKQMVDDKGIILPTEDVDLDQLGKVIKITGEGLAAPSDPRPGVMWKAKASSSDMGEGDPRIQGAAKLAGFLRTETRAHEGLASPALHFLEIIVTDFARRGLFMVNDEGAEVCWGAAPGDERPGRLSAEQKWVMLLEWRQSTRSRFLKEGDYWEFTKKGLHHRCTHQGSPHAAAEVTEAGKDQPAAVGKPAGSG
ncbi:MAG: hypothetical protein ACHRXM_38000 [Isosphaerales bacterium]